MPRCVSKFTIFKNYERERQTDFNKIHLLTKAKSQ